MQLPCCERSFKVELLDFEVLEDSHEMLIEIVIVYEFMAFEVCEEEVVFYPFIF